MFVFLVDTDWDFAPSYAPWLQSAAALALFVGYYLWIAVDLARKRDPIYDRIAGTAVVRMDARRQVGENAVSS